MKILVVDDDSGSRKLLQLILEDRGQVDLVENGTEAVNRYRQSLEEKEPYDLVLLDIMLPDITGHEVLHEIREIENEPSNVMINEVKVIMISALGDSKNITKAFDQLVDGYITKPIRREILEKEIESLNLK